MKNARDIYYHVFLEFYDSMTVGNAKKYFCPIFYPKDAFPSLPQSRQWFTKSDP